MGKIFIGNLLPKFARYTIDLCGKSGEDWLNDLPQIIGELENLRSLKVSAPFPNPSYNFVAPLDLKQ